MLRTALSPAIRAAFDEYFIRFPNECLDDRLSGDDWGLIEKIQSFLSRLTHTTMSAQGADATLGKVIPQMDFILGTYENAKEQFKDDPIIATMINSGWSKMEKYYQLLEDTPAYIAATVLSPNLKWEYIESSWNEEWLPKAKEMMRKFWEDEYKPQDLTGFTCDLRRLLTTPLRIGSRLSLRSHHRSTNTSAIYLSRKGLARISESGHGNGG